MKALLSSKTITGVLALAINWLYSKYGIDGEATAMVLAVQDFINAGAGVWLAWGVRNAIGDTKVTLTGK